MFSRYGKSIRENLVFICGEERGAVRYKQRRFLFLSLPAAAVLLFAVLFLLGNGPVFSALYSAGIGLGAAAVCDGAIYKKAKDRRIQMRFALSGVLERIALLLDAGVTLWNAIVIVAESGGDGALIGEIRLAVQQFSGVNGYYYEPEAAFEEMARRCTDPSVGAFVSLIVQNARKGTSELAELLRMQAVYARSERRMLAKQMSEEASTLMLLPSVMVLAAVLVLAAAPAIIQLL